MNWTKAEKVKSEKAEIRGYQLQIPLAFGLVNQKETKIWKKTNEIFYFLYGFEE